VGAARHYARQLCRDGEVGIGVGSGDAALVGTGSRQPDRPGLHHTMMFSRCARLPATRLTTARLLRYNSSAAPAKYEHILTSRPDPAVALITLNRPKALNALSSPLFAELNAAVAAAEADDAVGAIVLTGSERAFAGG
jgi:hypothetical protein